MLCVKICFAYSDKIYIPGTLKNKNTLTYQFNLKNYTYLQFVRLFVQMLCLTAFSYLSEHNLPKETTFGLSLNSTFIQLIALNLASRFRENVYGFAVQVFPI